MIRDIDEPITDFSGKHNPYDAKIHTPPIGIYDAILPTDRRKLPWSMRRRLFFDGGEEDNYGPDSNP